MVELLVYIRHVLLWEFKDKKATETAKKSLSVNDECIIIDRQVRN